MNRPRERRSGGQPSRTKEPPRIAAAEIKEIVEQGGAEKLNEVGSKLGEYYAWGNERERLAASQIRNVLDRLQRMPKYGDGKELQLLRPLLAYAAGRDTTPGRKVRNLQGIIDQGIQMVSSEETFENLRNFFEAIVAYHRYHGGK